MSAMTTKAISDLSNELRRIRRRLGGFDYASVEDRIAEELLSSGYIRRAAPDGGDGRLREALVAPAQPQTATWRVEHDGFEGVEIGSYTTLEGKHGAVLQQTATRVVHVYGRKWLTPILSQAKPGGNP